MNRLTKPPPRAGGVFLVIVLLVCSCLSYARAVEESRNVVFALEDELPYPKFETTIWNAFHVEAFLATNNIWYHIPGTLTLSYDGGEVRPVNTVPLVIRFIPRDGPGYEYERENGLVLEAGMFVFDWQFRCGNNFEEDFVPPMTGDTRHFSDMTAGLWAKSIFCLGGLAVGLNEVEEDGGAGKTIRLTLEEPSDGISAYFEELNTTQIMWTQPTALDDHTVNLVINEWPGRIRISAEVFSFHILPSGSSNNPHLTVSLVKNWFCGQNPHDFEYQWELEEYDMIKVDFEQSESDSLVFDLESNVANGPDTTKVQDLVHRFDRLVHHLPPPIGAADTLVSIIKNLHGPICKPYDSISIHYFIDDGFGAIAIGDTVLVAGNQKLDDFNNGTVDSILVEFSYDSTCGNYILVKDHQWNARRPHYEALMTAALASNGGSCSGWSFAVEGGVEVPANNLRRLPFPLPLPDLAAEGLVDNERAYVEYGDTASFQIRVKNRGEPWPPELEIAGDLPDSVYLVLSAVYEGKNDIGEWQVKHVEYVDRKLITPIGKGEVKPFDFEHVTPSQTLLSAFLPIDRVRYEFAINGGQEATNWRVWESSFGNNELVAGLPFTDYPDCALPSDSLFTDGDSVVASMPHAYFSGPEERYVYLTDKRFFYSPPGVEPESLMVELGVGQTTLLPDSNTWKWYPCDYLQDVSDNSGKHWKVYRTDLGDWTPPDYPGFSYYCFRASLDCSDHDTTCLYIDKDGASSVYKENLFYPDSVGTVEDIWTAIELPKAHDAPRLSLKCRPNPLTKEAVVVFDLPEASSAMVTVHDVAGRLVRVIWDGRGERGPNTVTWDGRAADGTTVPSGVYLVSVESCGTRCAYKLVVAR